jgi:putative tricarboxylic transport membrane protein
VSAQSFRPSRLVEVVVASGPGGGADALARSMVGVIDKEKLLPIRLQVTNKPGGGGSAVAMNYLAEKKGDAHVLAVFSSTWVTNPLVSAEHTLTHRDLTPIARLLLEPAVIVVKADSPFKTLQDFIDAARQSPGKLRQSGGSVTARDNVIRFVLQKHTGAQWSFISFPGGAERIAALLGGHVDMTMLEPQEAGEHIRSGSLRVLAQVSEKRLASLASVPTLQEAGFAVPHVPQVRGISGPPAMPSFAVAYWEEFVGRLVQTPGWKKYLQDNQYEDGFLRSAEFGAFADEYFNRMREILKDAGVKVAR